MNFLKLDHHDFLKASGPEMAKHSRSQLFQDLFVLTELGLKKNGFFVEFGACDGLWDNNTYLLEKCFGWQGVLAEPARVFHEDLRKHRPSCRIDFACVWRDSGSRLPFHESEKANLSKLKSAQAFPRESEDRVNGVEGRTYEVESISLTDLLAKHGAPRMIDYLSIDTEGCEFEILEAHDWKKYHFRILTVEHNFDLAKRAKIFEFLSTKGYVRKYEGFSDIDDWYVLNP